MNGLNGRRLSPLNTNIQAPQGRFGFNTSNKEGEQKLIQMANQNLSPKMFHNSMRASPNNMIQDFIPKSPFPHNLLDLSDSSELSDMNDLDESFQNKSYHMKLKESIFGNKKVENPLDCDNIDKRNKDCERMTPMEYQHVYQIKNLRKFTKQKLGVKKEFNIGNNKSDPKMKMYTDELTNS